MKNYFLSILFILLINNSFAQDLDYPRLGVGFQGSFPAWGLSAKADFDETNSAQAIIGVVGPFSSYYGRYLYNFNESGDTFVIKPYVFAQAGMYSYDYYNFYDSYLGTKTENVFGYGAGAGIEWHYAPFTDKLRFNLEVGYSKVDFNFYNFKAIMFGAGIHYHFNL